MCTFTKAAAARLRGRPDELVEVRLRRAMIRQRHFADTDDLVDEQQVLLDAARERLHRDAVVARVHERGDALLVQTARLGEQAGEAAGHAVGPEAPDNSRHACANRVGEHQFRRAGGVAALPAAADQMNVAVNEARYRQQARRVDSVAVRFRNPDAGFDADGLSARDEDVGEAAR
jgi:hypothetical protein